MKNNITEKHILTTLMKHLGCKIVFKRIFRKNNVTQKLNSVPHKGSLFYVYLKPLNRKKYEKIFFYNGEYSLWGLVPNKIIIHSDRIFPKKSELYEKLSHSMLCLENLHIYAIPKNKNIKDSVMLFKFPQNVSSLIELNIHMNLNGIGN